MIDKAKDIIKDDLFRPYKTGRKGGAIFASLLFHGVLFLIITMGFYINEQHMQGAKSLEAPPEIVITIELAQLPSRQDFIPQDINEKNEVDTAENDLTDMPPAPKPLNNDELAIKSKSPKIIEKKEIAQTDSVKKFEKHKPKDALKTQAKSKNYSAGKENAPFTGTQGREDAEYANKIRAILNAHRIYPRYARQRKMQGQAVVEIYISKTGQILDFKLSKSTGHHVLDEAVIAMIKKVPAFPSLPTSAAKPMWFKVPVDFRIK